jgi:predicted Zn-ribbon and HTH transcriptional regulator
MTKHLTSSESPNLPARLFAIARGLEDEGQFNVAKLFRALAFGSLYRATLDRPRVDGDLERELELAVAELRRLGTAETVLERLETARGMDFVNDWPTLTEIPNPYVCRNCGEVILVKHPDRCPNCQARRLTLQEVPPTYFLEPMDPPAIIDALASNRADVEQIVEGVSDKDAERGQWPMKQIVAHLIGAERLLVGRARRILEEDEPELGSVGPADFAGSEPVSISGLLDRYQESRRATSELARKLSPEQWQRTGRHPEWGRLTVQSQLAYVVRHEQSHLAELEARRQGR